MQFFTKLAHGRLVLFLTIQPRRFRKDSAKFSRTTFIYGFPPKKNNNDRTHIAYYSSTLYFFFSSIVGCSLTYLLLYIYLFSTRASSAIFCFVFFLWTIAFGCEINTFSISSDAIQDSQYTYRKENVIVVRRICFE